MNASTPLQIFPRGFPKDFSVLLGLRTRTSTPSRVPLFSIYSSESEEVLAILVGSEIALYYQDMNDPLSDPILVQFPLNINDEKWHRLGLSVKGDSITLLADCTREITKRFPRKVNATIATDGLILIGVQLMEEEGYFTVRICINLKNLHNL